MPSGHARSIASCTSLRKPALCFWGRPAFRLRAFVLIAIYCASSPHITRHWSGARNISSVIPSRWACRKDYFSAQGACIKLHFFAHLRRQRNWRLIASNAAGSSEMPPLVLRCTTPLLAVAAAGSTARASRPSWVSARSSPPPSGAVDRDHWFTSAPMLTWSRTFCATVRFWSRSRLCRRSEERRVGKECRYRRDWSSDVCSSDLRRRGPGSLVYFGADANMVENFLRNGPFLVEVAVVPPAIHVVADKPSHGRPRHDIAGKVLPRAHSSHHHGGSEGIGQNRNDPRVRIRGGDRRGQAPTIDGVSRRKPGVPPAVGAVPKVAFTVAFERPRAVGRQFDCFHNKGAVDQSFECQQAGFAQPYLVRAGSDEIEPGADRDQGVRGAGERRPLADRNLTRRVGKLFHRPLIGGEERRGGGSEDGPEFHILFAGVERTGPDGLLVLKNVLWHAQKWMENPRSFPQVLLL